MTLVMTLAVHIGFYPVTQLKLIQRPRCRSPRYARRSDNRRLPIEIQLGVVVIVNVVVLKIFIFVGLPASSLSLRLDPFPPPFPDGPFYRVV